MIYKFLCLKFGAAFVQSLCLLPHTGEAQKQVTGPGCPLASVYLAVEAPTAPDLGGKACEGWEPIYDDPTRIVPVKWEWSQGEYRRYIGANRTMKRVTIMELAK